jgi:hypothetical protein
MADDFEKQLVGAFDGVVKQIEKGIRSAVVDGLRKAVLFSPQQTGWLKSNFRIAVNSEDVALNPSTRPKPGTTVLTPDTATEAAKLETFKSGDQVTIANAVPYSIFIDRGTSKIAAANITERVAQFVSSLIERKFGG